MKIAILSDIHGNYDAWKAVSNQFIKQRIERIWVLGDICGYYYQTDEILNELFNYEFEFIRGNHEVLLKDLMNNVIREEEIRIKYGSGHRFCHEKLTNEQLDFITGAPDYKQIEIDNLSVFLCHGSPLNPNQYLYPDTDIEILNKCHVKDFNFIFAGHSHYQFAHYYDNSVLINPGSVGQSRQTGSIANWAIIDVKSRSFELKSTPYDPHNLIDSIKLNDPDIPYLQNILTRNTHDSNL